MIVGVLTSGSLQPAELATNAGFLFRARKVHFAAFEGELQPGRLGLSTEKADISNAFSEEKGPVRVTDHRHCLDVDW
jgi:hypothetical protein